MVHLTASSCFRAVSPIALVEPGAASQGQLAELRRDLIRHAIEFLMTLAQAARTVVSFRPAEISEAPMPIRSRPDARNAKSQIRWLCVSVT